MSTSLSPSSSSLNSCSASKITKFFYLTSPVKSKSCIFQNNYNKASFAYAPWKDEPYKTSTMLINNERHSRSLGHISKKKACNYTYIKKSFLTTFFISVIAGVFNYCLQETAFVFHYLIYARLMVKVFHHQIPFAP